MADFNKKQYLDLAGLKAFWGIIKDKFVSEVSLTVGDTGAVFTSTNGKGTETTIGTIPIATTTQAGLMSKEQVKSLEAVSGNIEAAVDIKGVAFGGNAATIASIGSGENVKTKHVNLDVKYDSTSKTIQVVDLNNNSAVLTSFDATAFIKDSFLSKAEVSIQDGKTGLLLTFELVNPETGDKTKEPIFVDLTSFVDTYTAGNGINIDENKVISVKVKDGEKYLTVGTTGLATTGIDDAIKAAADAAQAAAEGTAKDYAEAAQAAAEDYADGLAKNYDAAGSAAQSLDDAKKYTDDIVGELPTTGEGDAARTMTVAEAIAAAVKDASDASDAADKALEDAKDYTDARLGDLGTVGTEPQTVKGYVDAAQDAAENYADGLNTAMNTRVEALEAIDHDHSNKAVLDGITAEKVAAWDSAEDKANDYTDKKIGTLADGATTVAAAIANAQNAANAYTDTVAGNVYAAIEAIPVADITLDNLNK